MRKASGWFEDKRCLFICKGMWGNEIRRHGYTQAMSELYRERDGTCVLMSTRDLVVAEEVDEEHSVMFGVRDDKKAGKILCKSAGIKEEVAVMK